MDVDLKRKLYRGTEPYIFISYSHQDKEQIFPYFRAMIDRGYRIWLDEGIYAGDPWTETLADHLAHCAVFTPILSPNFIKSPNCLDEVRDVNKEKQKIVPIWLNKINRDDVPHELKFLFSKSQELQLDKFHDAAAFAAYLDYEKNFQQCREKINAETGIVLRFAKIVTERPVGPSPAFVGREDKLKEIANAFRENHAVVDLWGMGGIGKSEICRKLFQNYAADSGTDFIKYIGWVTWRDTLKGTFYQKFPDISETETDINRYWTLVQNYINQKGRDLLIIIDNADSMTDAAELTRLGCRFLVTSRNRQANSFPIPAKNLTPEQCRILYRRALNENNENISDITTINDDAPDEILDEILRRAAYHALAVKLLAKTQAEADLSEDELLEKLKESGFDLTEIETDIYYRHNPETDDDNDGYAQFIEHMARIFDLSNLRDNPKNADALRALQGMSLLAPNVYIPMKTARKWLGLSNLNGLNRATDAGWLNRQTDENGGRSVSVHPIIAAVVQREAPPDAEFVDAVAGELFKDMIPGTTEVFKAKLPIVEHAATLDRVARKTRLQTANYGLMLGQMG